jgi:hypothetical protein
MGVGVVSRCSAQRPSVDGYHDRFRGRVRNLCVFVVLNLLRVNLFLDELTGRADWQNMMLRFRESGFDDLRWFVNVHYLKDAPFKIGVASVIGAVMGLVGGTIGWLKPRFAATT